MALKLTHAIRHLLLRNHIRISRTTDEDKVRDFLSSVKPLETNHDLIRLGGDTDGGYLVPNDIEGIDVCFSPGVSQVAAFEEDLTKRGIQCFLADYSVDSPPVENDLFDFEKKYLGPFESGNFMTLESWIKIKAPTRSDFILQMDIEGAEYGVLFDTSPETLRKFRVLVVEFHRLDALCDKMGYELISLVFAKILKDFAVVHIHPNNCAEPVHFQGLAIPPVMEFTFLRKDRINARAPATSFPHELDRANVPSNKDFALPKCWYGQN
jgi:Methyltransferase FkbM domain